ncbi:hypothetical protein WMF28_15145 [Sorangium sp. So ce590]|uniref:hypothetical protein n=1 Tax=Sorangium sp. So ce590 TaxID=3133317 RepID=UPI003F63F6E7
MPPSPHARVLRSGARGALAGIAGALLGTLDGSAAHAQGRYESALLGGRSALLGGTGVVLGVDGAAPFLNPATIIRIEDRNIAFSAAFFRYAHRTLEAWHQPGPVDSALYGDLRLDHTTVSDHGLDSLPDAMCYCTVEGAAREIGDAVEGSAAAPPKRTTPREPMRAPAQED